MNSTIMFNPISRFALLIKRHIAPYRFRVIRSLGPRRPLRILDIGCGNKSCQLTRHWLTVETYHGLDRECYSGEADDYKQMDKFLNVDLTTGDLVCIPQDYYDVVILSHVVEHLEDGEEILRQLTTKLRRGGIVYVETPSFRTLNFPHGDGFLNFYDDPTHVRVYDRRTLATVMMKEGLQVLRCAYRRDWVRLIFFSPVALLINLLYYIPFRRRILATGLWDLLGVASVVVGLRRSA